MAERCFLGVDLGAESGRVVAGLFDGSHARLEELHRFPNGAVNVVGTLRWDVLRLWSEIQTGLTKAGADYGQQIASVGVDTWGVDYVLLTKQFEMLGQPFHYRDARTRGMLEFAFSRVSRPEIFAQTGLQFMEISTLYQLLAFQQAHLDLLQLADRFLLMPDFFHWLLCGSTVVEFTNATTTQCLHPTTGDWSFDLLRRFDLPTSLFPQVVAPGTKLGPLRSELADRLRLARIDVVAPATHDTGSAVAAVPTQRTGSADWAYISSGTWSLMGVEVQQAVLSPQALAGSVTNEGGLDGTYRLLKNIMGLWLVQECRRSFQRQGTDYDYAQLARLAGEAEPFRSLVDPDDARFLNPADMPAAIAEFCTETNQSVPRTPGQFVRCALESLALKYRVVLGRLEELTGTPVEVVHVVGGGSQNEMLNQFTANATGKPVIAGPVEATALGNVLVQARSAGEIGSLAEIRDVVRASCKPKRYDPADEQRWRETSERFHKLLDRPT